MTSLILLDAFIVDRNSKLPIYRQLYDLIQQGITTGKFTAESKLPSSRILSKELNVSRSTVTTAYDQLIAEGYLITRPGSGTVVAAALLSKRSVVNKIQRGEIDLLPEMLSPLAQTYLKRARKYTSYKKSKLVVSLPSRSGFPNAVWGKLLAKHARKALDVDAGYDNPSGIDPLKVAIAEYLGMARAVVTSAKNVLILSSTQAAVDLLCRALLKPGDRAWLEDPGYNGVRIAMKNYSANITGINIDDEGLCLPKHENPPKIIYTTPSHQYPTGVTMSYVRRMSLLDYAHKNKCWVLEDDYDSEFRYSGKPLPSLQGLDQMQQVIYLGTFSKSLSPSLRVAYIVAPDNLTPVLEALMADTGQGVNLSVQHALAEFIEAGHYSLHIRKTRQQYSIKQQLLVEALNKYLSKEVTVSSSQAGLQTLVYFNNKIVDVEVEELATSQGFSVRALSPLYQTQHPRHGLILGFAATECDDIDPAVKELAEIIKKLSQNV